MWPMIAVFQAFIIGMPKSTDSTLRILKQLEKDLHVSGQMLGASTQELVESGAVANYRPDRCLSCEMERSIFRKGLQCLLA